jgi:hypothetical protein
MRPRASLLRGAGRSQPGSIDAIAQRQRASRAVRAGAPRNVPLSLRYCDDHKVRKSVFAIVAS